jgi:hypothetical protein
MPDDALLTACKVERTKRSGPGGQHRNKVETAVVLTHRPTGLRAEASERRSQAANRAMAIFRLRLKLALQLRTLPGDAPTEMWINRVSGRRISVSPEHEQFPALLAEALDVLAVNEWTVAAAAAFLGVSGTQLVRFLKLEPESLQQLNAHRHRLGLPPCR